MAFDRPSWSVEGHFYLRFRTAPRTCGEAKRERKNWNTNEFVTVPNVPSALRLGPRGDRWFIDRWLERFLTPPSARALLADGQARDPIKERGPIEAGESQAQIRLALEAVEI